MLSHLFPALHLMFLLVFCALCGAASAGPANMSVELFKQGPINVSKLEGGGGEKRLDIDYAFSPSLVGANGVLVALVEARGTDGKRYILTKHTEAKEANWDKTIKDEGKNWKAQVALTNENGDFIAYASVAKNDSVYVFSASKSGSAPFLQEGTNTNGWEFKLTVGRITNGGDAAGKKKIEWKTHNVSNRFVDIQEKLQGAYPLSAAAFLTEDETFVFVVKALSDSGKKNVFLIASSKDTKNKFTSFVEENTAGCYSGFFPWGNRLFMVPRYLPVCSSYRVKESNDMGKTWEEASGPLAQKLNDPKGEKGSFTSITIEEIRVLLFTERKSRSGAFSKDADINLLITDGENVADVGPIVTNVTSISGGSFLYTNNELFFLSHQETVRGVEKIILTHLEKQLGTVKGLLKTWSVKGHASEPVRLLVNVSGHAGKPVKLVDDVPGPDGVLADEPQNPLLTCRGFLRSTIIKSLNYLLICENTESEEVSRFACRSPKAIVQAKWGESKLGCSVRRIDPLILSLTCRSLTGMVRKSEARVRCVRE